jgi:dipeptidyl aminopeptidase/acylaminoacyl peptidase
MRPVHGAVAGLSLAAACLSGAAASADTVPPTLENLLFASRSPRQLAWSPDGASLALSIAGGGPSQIAIVDVATKALRVVAEGASPVWSPDGGRLAFLRAGDLWSIEVAGTGERRLTNDREDERTPAWSPDGRTIAFMSSRSGFQDVWVVSADGGAPTKLTTEAMFHDMTRFGVSWSPDSSAIAYVSNKGGWEHDELWVVPAGGGAPRQISRGLNVTSQPEWSPDGRRITFNGLAHDIYRYGDMADIYVADVEAATVTKVKTAALASDNMGAAPVLWSADGKSLFFVYFDRGNANIWSVPADGGVAAQVTDLTGDLDSVTFSRRSQRFAFVHSTSTYGGMVKVLHASGGEPATVAEVGSRFEGVIEPVSVSFRSFDGLYVHGFLFKPRGFTESAKYPALVQVHGGGHNLIMNGFNPVEQFLAQRGYVVLAINYRGSSGYGRPFQDLAIEDWGGKQALDAAAAGEFLKRQAFSNGKVGIYGGSYGGITTLAAITQSPDTFDAAVPMRGIYDFAAAWVEADRIGKIFIQRGHRGTPKENPQAYARSSSLSRVERIKTPLLVMHGGRDVRAPARQHVLLIEALKKNGKQFEEQVYADEAHGFSRRSQLDMYGRLVAWFDKYLH